MKRTENSLVWSYFDEEEKPVENPDDLEYQPAPGSPSGAGRSHEESEDTEAKPAADDDDDPLDSFMADIDRQVKVQEVMDKHRAENPTTFPKNKKDTKYVVLSDFWLVKWVS